MAALDYSRPVRRSSRKVMVGGIAVGGDGPVTIQSMTTTDTRDVEATVRQIRRLQRAGCELIRVAVLDRDAAGALSGIKAKISLPLVADIHFDYRLALCALEQGVDKIRLNPGNVREESHIAQVLRAAKRKKVPIRIGLNSGSVLRRPGRTLVDDMVDAAVAYQELFRRYEFDDMVISLKAPDVPTTIEAYRRMASVTDAPLHLGITAAGAAEPATIKSSIGIGALLLEGIGDTLRVSLTDDPVREVTVAREILRAVNVRGGGIELISCPTCGRTTTNLVALVRQVRRRLAPLESRFVHRRLRVAIMGCIVNGPGEARDADIGIAWGGKIGMLFRRGRKVQQVRKEDILNVLVAEVQNELD